MAVGVNTGTDGSLPKAQSGMGAQNESSERGRGDEHKSQSEMSL